MTTLGWVNDLQIFCKRYQGRVFPRIALLQVRKSWIQEILAWGIQNPRLWNKLKEFGILGYTDKVSVFQNLENVRNPQRVIQNPRTSRGELYMSKSSMQCTAFPSDVTSAKTMKRRPYWSTIRELKQRRFSATHVNRKWGLLPFYMPGHYQICIAEFLFSYKDDLPKGFNQTTAQCCKKSTSGWRPPHKNAVA